MGRAARLRASSDGPVRRMLTWRGRREGGGWLVPSGARKGGGGASKTPLCEVPRCIMYDYAG